MTKQKKNDNSGKGNVVHLDFRKKVIIKAPLTEPSSSLQNAKVDDLLQRMRVNDDGHSAYEELISMREAAVPRLIELMVTGSFETPDEAGVVLGGIGRPAVPKLIESLTTVNRGAREGIIGVMAYITSQFTPDDWREVRGELGTKLLIAANIVSEEGHFVFASRIRSEGKY